MSKNDFEVTILAIFVIGAFSVFMLRVHLEQVKGIKPILFYLFCLTTIASFIYIQTFYQKDLLWGALLCAAITILVLEEPNIMNSVKKKRKEEEK